MATGALDANQKGREVPGAAATAPAFPRANSRATELVRSPVGRCRPGQRDDLGTRAGRRSLMSVEVATTESSGCAPAAVTGGRGCDDNLGKMLVPGMPSDARV
jgi:hypothetical protein